METQVPFEGSVDGNIGAATFGIAEMHVRAFLPMRHGHAEVLTTLAFRELNPC